MSAQKPMSTSWLKAAAIVVPAALSAVLALHVAGGRSLAFDAALLHWLRSLASPFLDSFALAATHGGDVIVVMLAVLAAVLGLAYRGRSRDGQLVVVAVVLAVAVNLLLKTLFERSRPDLWPTAVVEASYSFPSGHAMASSALAFSVIMLAWHSVWRWWTLALGTAYVLLIGWTRLYLGVHYPSDVLAGWCVSWLCVVAVYWLYHVHNRGSSRTKSHTSDGI